MKTEQVPSFAIDITTMKYKNLNDSEEIVDFQQAVVQGLGRKKGLFVPEEMPILPSVFFEQIETFTRQEIAFQVLRPFISVNNLSDKELLKIVDSTIAFPIPVEHLKENLSVLELFHGPTMAFKDVGARFMARCLGKFTTEEKKVTVLVATSGDTGSAVAQGFYQINGVEVVILFPKGKVSPFQEFQMTSLGENITAVEVDGTFDDCQALVKQALEDKELKQQVNLSTANSINVARFLPQMLYYFYAYQQVKQTLIKKKQELVFAVPSGNFGNLTAGLYAKAMGLPVKKFVAVTNANDTFYQYMQTGNYAAKPSVQTLSNAMDVGDPSNFVRIQHLYHQSLDAMRQDIVSHQVNDDETLKTIQEIQADTGVVLDPHTAVGFVGLRNHLKVDELGIVLATASPQKFDAVIQHVLPNYKSPKVDLSTAKKQQIENNYKAYKNLILRK